MKLHQALTIIEQYQEWRKGNHDDIKCSPKELTEAIDRILQVPEDIKAAYDTGAFDMGIDSEGYYETIKNQE